MSKFYVIAHLNGNEFYVPINNKNYTDDWVDAIEKAREYSAKYPDGVVEAVEEGGCCLRVICTSKEITVINCFPFCWNEYLTDVDTQSILEDVHPG